MNVEVIHVPNGKHVLIQMGHFCAKIEYSIAVRGLFQIQGELNA